MKGKYGQIRALRQLEAQWTLAAFYYALAKAKGRRHLVLVKEGDNNCDNN